MTKLTELKGIGDKNAILYEKLGIRAVEDCVFYFPRDYIVYEKIAGPEEFVLDSMTAFCAVVCARPLVKRAGKLTITSVMLSCDHTAVNAVWFNMPYLSKSLNVGSTHIFRGIITAEGDHFHVRQPMIWKVEEYERLLGRINPVYALTKGLTNRAVTKTVGMAFDYLGDGYDRRLYDMHFPKDEDTLIKARESLVYDEFLAFILSLRINRSKEEYDFNSFNIIEDARCERIIEKLPYKLTNAQMRVWNEVKSDLTSKRSMRRLIQGDVGSGKTIIATLAAIMTSLSGKQSAIMAPTEILAGQHYDYISALLKGSGCDLKVVLLTGSMTKSAADNVREMIKNNEADIIIGTHALFQEKVIYNDLALVITDEQHRFGVMQRDMLSQKNSNDSCHILVMSATPIPRTLAMILYGDLDISVIDELPAHKLPIKNAVVNESYRKKAYDFIRKEVLAHHQAYVICPLIEESEGLEAKNVSDMTKELSGYLSADGIKVSMLHGQMKASEKQKIMDSFANGDTDVLVSTTVVEVGINVPNATVMLIEDADRFGLAALHQLRGRIGRGRDQSYCIFMSGTKNERTMKRLEILKNSNDGFAIAEEDLKQRGPGDIFGIRQSGDIKFRIGDIYNDSAVLKRAANDADVILKEDPDLSDPAHAQLRRKVEEATTFSMV